mmetsp:Transcript_28576/g.67010  ORF Transcript_28576/g.67010 Transcript_28576/m.67010 type:complete len:247 (-) Transcript_28576:41-781(-)
MLPSGTSNIELLGERGERLGLTTAQQKGPITPRSNLAFALVLQEEVFRREDDLFLAYNANRSPDLRSTGKRLSEGEISLMLRQMCQSHTHLFNTSDAHVSEFLWAEMNSLGNEEEEEEEEEDVNANPPPLSAAEFAAKEDKAWRKLCETYNKLVDHCVLLSKAKFRSLQRLAKSGGTNRKLRQSMTAFQGKIGKDGSVGDTGDIAGYAAIEAAASRYSAEENNNHIFFIFFTSFVSLRRTRLAVSG